MSDRIDFFESILLSHTDNKEPVLSYHLLSGGCIDQVVKLKTATSTFLLKWKDRLSDQFELEANGLRLLRETGTIDVPEVWKTGEFQGCSFILMDFIQTNTPSTTFWEDFGSGLAQLHKTHSPNSLYGLDRDNYIGSLKQTNAFSESWIDFFIKERLEKQLQLAYSRELVDNNFLQKFRSLYPHLPNILINEAPSLLHGDLWSGNYLINSHGNASIIDPAVYYGNREIELALTHLFGGFDSRFYQSYQEAWPLESGFENRMEIYNLYPLLVHVNLFGTSYLSAVLQVLKKYT